jgi:hypothetical protein
MAQQIFTRASGGGITIKPPHINWGRLLKIIFAAAVVIFIGYIVYSYATAGSDATQQQTAVNSAPPAAQDQPGGSVPVLEPVGSVMPANYAPAPSGATAKNFPEFSEESTAINDLILGPWHVDWMYREKEPNSDFRKVSEQRFSLHRHLGNQGIIRSETLAVKQVGGRVVSPSSKIGEYQIFGWSDGNRYTPIPPGERLGAKLTVTFTNGKITNLAFQ